MILRNFLYLDTATVDDYLSTLEGSIPEGTYDQTDLDKKGKGGKAGYKIIEGNIAAESSSEIKQKRAVTDAAKFQRLFELLEESEQYRYLDVFDSMLWGAISRGDILEVQANIRFPDWFGVTQAIDDLSPLIDLMAAIGEEQIIDRKTRNAIQSISGFGKLLENRPMPIVFHAISTLGYDFTANLAKQYLRVTLSDLQGEATVYGKVQRILPKGEKHEVFSIFPAFSTSLPSLSKAQKDKMQRDLAKQNLAQVIKGPAIILSPVAIYR